MARSWMPVFVVFGLVVASTSFAGGELAGKPGKGKAAIAPPPPYPAELECRYQAFRRSSGMAWYQAPPAIPFSPCGPFAPNVRDKFDFGPCVDGFNFGL